MRKILIDLQALQGENADRGIGRYLKGFVKEFVETQSTWEVEFLLNGSRQLDLKSAHQFLRSLINEPKIHVWYPPENAMDSFQELAEISLEALYLKIGPDLLVIGSLFERERNSIISHISTRLDTAVILHDFVPVLFKEQYLADSKDMEWYLGKLEKLKCAKYLFCISESTLRDALEILKVGPEKLFYIGAGAPSTPPLANQQQTDQQQTDQQQTNQNEDTLLCVGGIDWRNGVERFLEAFSHTRAHKSGLKLKIVCSIDATALDALKKLARTMGLGDIQIQSTDYMSDAELAQTYQVAMFCVFPGIYEGYCLPILEAMHFGKAVIVANTSSLVEIQSNESAGLDPTSALDIAETIDRVYSNPDLRRLLESETPRVLECNSWNKVVARFEAAISNDRNKPALGQTSTKPRLAYFTPLPPAKSGISYYSVRLLPELARFYDITVIASKTNEPTPSIAALPIRTASWFEENSDQFERIVYQIGNSPWHEEALRIMESHPGISVIHDFYLGGFHSWAQGSGARTNIWDQALLHSHGFGALAKLQEPTLKATLLSTHPANLLVQQYSIATLFHSERALDLNQKWAKFRKDEVLEASIPLIPTVERRDNSIDDGKLFSSLGIDGNTTVIASFGFVSENKGHLEIVEALSEVIKKSDGQIVLVFVGSDSSAEFGLKLRDRISSLGLERDCLITGWVSDNDYQAWLARANVVVQLRKSIYGESSAALLDALNFGKPVITNRGLAEVSLGNFLKVLSLDFTPQEVFEAVQEILNSTVNVASVKNQALDYLSNNHSPQALARILFEKVEAAYSSGTAKMFDFLAHAPSFDLNESDLESLASSLADSIEPAPRVRQIFIDVSTIIFKDEGTGIHRVVNKVGAEFLKRESPGEIVVPVFFESESGKFTSADSFAQAQLDSGEFGVAYGEHIQAWPGDYFLGLDISFRDLKEKSQELERLRARGVKVGTVLYDILPVEHPEFFIDGFSAGFEKWLHYISDFDDVFCISKTSANKYHHWQALHAPYSVAKTEVFELGSDFAVQSRLAPNAERRGLAFLMVGTLEPRKGHLETLQVFNILWEAGSEATLTLIGKQGWLTQELVRSIKSHREYARKLFWLDKATDADLANLYKSSSALIAASYGEGLGLPLLEAGFYGLPVIARDIEIFREVASPATVFYNEETGPSLLTTIKGIIEGEISLDFAEDAFPTPTSWSDSANSLWHLLHKGTDL